MKTLLLLLLTLPSAALAGPVRLTLAPDTVRAGEAAVLSWQAGGATAVYLSGVGPVAAADSLVVRPGQSTTYLLVAEGPEGVVVAEARLAVLGGGRGLDGFDPEADDHHFRYPLTDERPGVAFVAFVNDVHRVLQDSLRFDVQMLQVSGGALLFVTNLAPRDGLAAPDPRIAGRRLSYLVEAAPPTASGAVAFTIRTRIEQRRKIERTWRPEDDESVHRTQAERVQALLKRSG